MDNGGVGFGCVIVAFKKEWVSFHAILSGTPSEIIQKRKLKRSLPNTKSK